MSPGPSLWQVSLIQFSRFRALWCVGPLAFFSILQGYKMAILLQTWTKVLLFIPRSQASWLVALTMVSCKFGDLALRPLIFVQCKIKSQSEIFNEAKMITYRLRHRFDLWRISLAEWGRFMVTYGAWLHTLSQHWQQQRNTGSGELDPLVASSSIDDYLHREVP